MLESRISSIIPACISQIITQVRTEIQVAIPSAVKQAVEQVKEEMKAEIIKHIEDDLYYQEERCNVAAMSQAETVENYTRRDNIRISGVQEDSDHTGNRNVPEKDSVTIKKVIEVATSIEVEVDERDISTAHRLPGRKAGKRVIIAHFARRLVKTQKQKEVVGSNVRIFEDISPARAKFLAMMKRDPRVESAWTREGTIFYLWKKNKRVYRVFDLLEAVRNLNYNFSDFVKCFQPSHSNIFPTSSCSDFT